MQSELFAQSNHEVASGERFGLQNPQLLRVALGEPVLAAKGSMVAYQGQVQFEHEGSGSVGKLIKKLVSSDDQPLMRVSGQGEVFFAADAGYVYVVDLAGDGLSVNGRNLLAFDAALEWDIERVKGAGILGAGMFNTTIQGSGKVALAAVGQPVVLDCSQQPTYVDVQAAVAWSSNLVPQMATSVNMRSMLYGGTGESVQYAFHGQGFVVVQPYEWVPPTTGSTGSDGQANRSGGGISSLFE